MLLHLVDCATSESPFDDYQVVRKELRQQERRLLKREDSLEKKVELLWSLEARTKESVRTAEAEEEKWEVGKLIGSSCPRPWLGSFSRWTMRTVRT